MPSSRETTGGALPAIDRTPLVEELQLSPEQRVQMRSIWESVRGQINQAFTDAQRLEKQREDELVALLNDEQRRQFEAISRKYADRYAELTRNRDQTFQNAVTQTKQLLNDEQKRKYQEILDTRVPAGAAGGGLSPTGSLAPSFVQSAAKG